jgi:hypothetical protein
MDNTHKSCSICLEDMDGKASFLPCFHGFHHKCFHSYITDKISMKRDINCPVCRAVHFAYGDKNYSYIMNELYVPKEDTTLGNSLCRTPTNKMTDVASVVIDIKPSQTITENSSQIANDVDFETIWLKYRYYIILVMLLCVLAFVMYMILKSTVI